MQSLTLQTEHRSVTGKKVKSLRRQGITPIHLYGKVTSSLSLQVDSALLQRLVIQAGGTTPVAMSVKGSEATHLTFIREVQRHPVTEAILHVDFYEVPTTETIRADVPVYLTGEAPAVRVQGGVLLQVLHSIEVECLPLEVPRFVEVDVSGLEDFEQTISVSSIALDPSVTIINDASEMIARVNPPRVVVEEAVAEAAEIGEAEEEEGAEERPAPTEPSKEA